MKRVRSLLSDGRWALPGILLLALALRLTNITFHSLWLDEAVEVGWARLPLAEIWARTSTLREISHPPLSYLLLHAWIRLFGDGEVAVRSFPVAAGIAMVLLIFALGASMGGRRGGLLAAFLAAVSPYLIWYSQETRMYALVGALSAAGFYCFWRGLEEGRLRWWAGFVVATVASVYTQILGGLLLPVEVLVALLYARQGKHALQGLLAVFVSALLLAPLALTAWGSSGATSTERVAPTIASLLTLTPVFLFLRQVPAGWQILAVPGLALAITGLVMLARRHPRKASALAAYIVVILAEMYLLSIWRLPIFGLPYVIIIAAPVLVAVGLGIDGLWQRRRSAGIVALLAMMLISLVGLRYVWDHGMGKEDWRAAASYISAHAQEGDAILAVPNYAAIPLTYYYRGDLPILGPFGGPVAADAIGSALQNIDDYKTVWLVWSHGEQVDPAGQVRRWLMERYPELTEVYPRGVEVRALATRYREPPPAGGPALATFGDALRLVGAESDPVVVAHDDTYHPPSGWVPVRLAWQRAGVADTTGDGLPAGDANLDGLQVRLRVTDDIGQVWGERLLRPTEVWRVYPPTKWQPGEVVRDGYDINMNPVTPRGTYKVELQVLDKDGKPLAVLGVADTTGDGPPASSGASGERYVVGPVEVR